MSDYWDYIAHGASSHNPIRRYFGAMDFIRDNVHGGARAFMDSLPVSGRIRNYANEIKKAEDRYNNTGVDEVYSSPYSGSIPFLNDAVGSFVKPARMASSLSKMYGAEIALDVARERHATAREWRRFQEMKNYGKMK